MQTAAYESSGCRLGTTEGQILPLEDVMLSAEARDGLARVTLRQTFRNGYAEPLAVTYQLPLPSDGAVSGFAFTIGDRKVIGEIDRRDAGGVGPQRPTTIAGVPITASAAVGERRSRRLHARSG